MTTTPEQEAIRVLREALTLIFHSTDYHRLALSSQVIVSDALVATATIQPVAAPEKRAPVQGYTPGIPWSLHLEAYDAYRKRYGSQQALIEGGCRGGFGIGELDMFIPGWRDKVSEIGRLKARIAELEAAAPAQAVPDEVRKAYDELIYAVARKWPGETRHQTALRYIREREQPSTSTAACAATPADSQKGEGDE